MIFNRGVIATVAMTLSACATHARPVSSIFIRQGKPTISYDVSKFQDNATDASTERALVTFKVKDYDAWKKVFDGDQQDRINAGMTTRGINVDINDPNKVTLVMVITDTKKTEDFMHTKELKHRMDSAGVVDAPDVFFYHVVKQY